MQLHIDKTNKIPAYKQIADQICELIKKKELKPGDKLPTERQLSFETGISRGTIKAAYGVLLDMGKIETIQGSGSFIANKSGEEGIKVVIEEIRSFLDRIEDVDMSLMEVESLFRKEIQKRMNDGRRVKVAWVDCCIESLTTANEQIGQMSKVEATSFVLADIVKKPELIEDKYDLVVTTPKHYEELITVIPEKIDRIQKVTLNMKLLSVIEIAKIPKDKVTIGLCISEVFKRIMAEQIMEFDNLQEIKILTNEKNLDELQAALDMSDYLLLPPEYVAQGNDEMAKRLSTFEARGGKIISFEYQLDRGSMIHFEEVIEKKWYEIHHINTL